jgi:hypothetical protein
MDFKMFVILLAQMLLILLKMFQEHVWISVFLVHMLILRQEDAWISVQEFNMASIILLIKIDYVYICVHKGFMVIGQQNNVFNFVQMVLLLKMILMYVYLIVLMVHLQILI